MASGLVTVKVTVYESPGCNTPLCDILLISRYEPSACSSQIISCQLLLRVAPLPMLRTTAVIWNVVFAFTSAGAVTDTTVRSARLRMLNVRCALSTVSLHSPCAIAYHSYEAPSTGTNAVEGEVVFTSFHSAAFSASASVRR